MFLRMYIKNRFGSRRGLMRSVAAEVRRMLGFYRHCEKIEFGNVKRLVFVCSGNICRSPLGEAVAKIHGVAAESFGLDTRGGDPADPRAVKYAADNRINLSSHRTRHIKQYHPEDGDLLIGMEPIHVVKLQSLFHGHVPITLAGLWLDSPIAYLHDPYNTCPDFFNLCSLSVERSARILAAKIKID